METDNTSLPSLPPSPRSKRVLSPLTLLEIRQDTPRPPIYQRRRFRMALKRSHTISLGFVLAFCLLSCSKRAAREAKRKNDKNSRSLHCLKIRVCLLFSALSTASSRGKMQQLPIILCCSLGSFSLLFIFSVVCSNLHTKVWHEHMNSSNWIHQILLSS